MKIGIITIYDSFTNLGSFLQAFCLQRVLSDMGYESYLIEKQPLIENIIHCVCKINPKREFFLRIKKCMKAVGANMLLNIKSCNESVIQDTDICIYGSDEIWNMENPYFKNEFFFGTGIKNLKKIAYAVSIGEMKEDSLNQNIDVAKGIFDFKDIFVRDDYTKEVLEKQLNKELIWTCDPTFLLPVSQISEPIKLPKEKYLLVYTYGIDKNMEENIKKFAKEKNLKIISVCFWHIWCDKIIQCSPMQFSTLIKNAEYVFTTTFHGAIFTMLNHKNCCIQPIRFKVKDVVSRMKLESRLIDKDGSYEEFKSKMELAFPEEEFERLLLQYRKESMRLLRESIERCCE